MSDNYYGCCGMCSNFDLNEKSFTGKYYCYKYKAYYLATDKGCSSYSQDSNRTPRDIDLKRGAW